MESDWGEITELVERLGSEKLELLFSLETVDEGWEDLGIKNGVHSHRRESGSGLYYIHGVGDMDFPAEVVSEVTRDYSRKAEWDQVFKEGRVVQVLTDHSRIVLEEFNTPWPVTNRDVCFATVTKNEADYIATAGFSVEVPSVPPKKGVVRAQMDIGGFIFRRLSPTSTRMTYLLFTDPRGSIPQMVINSIQKKQTENISRIREFLQKNS